jgi:hypothetical protein
MKSVKLHNRWQSLLLSLYLCALASLSSAALVSSALGQPPDPRAGAVDWILVVDTSQSMRGMGGTKNIFAQVKSALAGFVRSARRGDTVTIYSFDSDTHSHPTVRIEDDTDIRDLLKTIDELKAEGDRTHTGKAIQDALTRAGELSRRSEAANRTPSVVLLTDGQEDVRGIRNPVSIPSNVEKIPGSQPYIFFVWLGEGAPPGQLGEFVNNPALNGRGEVVNAPGAAQLEELSQRIRKTVEEAPTPTPPPAPTPVPTPIEISLRVEPLEIDFGQIEPGEQTSRAELKITSTAATRVGLSLKGSGSSEIKISEPEGAAVELIGGEQKTLKVRLTAIESAADGLREMQLILMPESSAADARVRPSVVIAKLNVTSVPLWRKLLKWLAIALILLLLLVAAYSFYKGDTPVALWRNWNKRNQLEGELELIRPAPPRMEDAYISLNKLATDRVMLSSLLPDGAGGDADAELTTLRKGNAKLLQLRRTGGVVRVNNTEVALTEVYDGDIIEVGDARLRLTWPTHERPVETDENL